MPTRLNLTRALVEALPKPEAGQEEYYDTKAPGLVVRISPKGTKTYQLFKRMPNGGRMVRVTLGRHGPHYGPENARRDCYKQLAMMNDGVDPAAHRRALRKELTLGQAFALYMERWAEPRKRTAAGDRARWRQNFAKWDGRRLSALTRQEVRDWHHHRCRDGHPADANRSHALLRKVINVAISEGWEGTNQAAGVTHAPEQSRERFLQRDEMPLFLAALNSLEPAQRTFRDLVLLALMTAQRRGNLVAMRWQALDLERGCWTLTADETKNKRPHTVPLIPPAIKLLEERREMVPPACPWVLPSDKQPTTHYADPKRSWAALLERTRLLALADAIAHKEGQAKEDERARALALLTETRAIAWGRKAPQEARTAPTLRKAIAQYETKAQAAGIATDGLGVSDLRFHDLRRSAASWMTIGGASLTVVGKALGHASPQATAVYARLDTEAQGVALGQAFAAMIGSGK